MPVTFTVGVRLQKVMGKLRKNSLSVIFIPCLFCSCGKCKDKTNLECVGKHYQTRIVLKCDLHSLLECRERAEQAKLFN